MCLSWYCCTNLEEVSIWLQFFSWFISLFNQYSEHFWLVSKNCDFYLFWIYRPAFLCREHVEPRNFHTGPESRMSQILFKYFHSMFLEQQKNFTEHRSAFNTKGTNHSDMIWVLSPDSKEKTLENLLQVGYNFVSRWKF